MADRLSGIVGRFIDLRRAPGSRVNAYAVADRIRADGGDVWGAVGAFGISHEHALRVRRGWRGDGRTEAAIAYRTRGYYGTPAGSFRAGRPSLELLEGGLLEELRAERDPAIETEAELRLAWGDR